MILGAVLPQKRPLLSKLAVAKPGSKQLWASGLAVDQRQRHQQSAAALNEAELPKINHRPPIWPQCVNYTGMKPVCSCNTQDSSGMQGSFFVLLASFVEGWLARGTRTRSRDVQESPFTRRFTKVSALWASFFIWLSPLCPSSCSLLPLSCLSLSGFHQESFDMPQQPARSGVLALPHCHAP